MATALCGGQCSGTHPCHRDTSGPASNQVRTHAFTDQGLRTCACWEGGSATLMVI